MVLAAFLGLEYWRVLTLPFVNDDYFFIDKTRQASLAAIWGGDRLVFGWYRPWSAELHYWALQRLFGLHEVPFHLVSFALWLGAMGLYYVLARRLVGPLAGAVAVAGVASLSLWAAPLIWVAGVQDLWMLLWVLGCLHLHSRDKGSLAAAALALALLSKETAAATPIIALAHSVFIKRRALGQAARETIPLFLLVAIWAVAHPTLRLRLAEPHGQSVETTLRPPLPLIALRTLLAQLNLDAWPHPGDAWGHVALAGGLGAALLALPVLLATRPAPRAMNRRRIPNRPAGSSGASSDRNAVRFGVSWAIAGWIPLFMPSIGWHAYYGSLGTLGAWLEPSGIRCAGGPPWRCHSSPSSPFSTPRGR